MRRSTAIQLNSAILLFSLSVSHALSSISASKATVGNAQVPGLKNGMDFVKLGDSDLIVSKICMGTMTYGEQNSLEEGVELLNCAFDKYGINFLDTGTHVIPTSLVQSNIEHHLSHHTLCYI